MADDKKAAGPRPSEPRKISIFVSSPADVMPERQRLERVAERMNGRLGGAVNLTCVRWEEQFYTADRTFQAQIAPSVACDLVISIFWTRLGTALPPEFEDKLPDGRPYPSGTAYELLTALEASKQKSLPDVFVFRKTSPSSTPIDNNARQAFNRQLDALEGFWEEWFLNREGQFRAAFNTFNNTDEFEAQVERLLRGWLSEKGLLRREVRWRIEEQGSPFRGLLPFDASHADVFFGRSVEIERGKERLADAAGRGAPFLLILGASGTGKSSLARAGLLPRLMAPGAVEGVDAWRIARVALGIGEHDPMRALAAGLLDSGALPELAELPNATPEGLADQLAASGNAAAGLARWAMERVVKQVREKERFDREASARLLLLVDQFEALFAADVTAERRRAFIATLDSLARSGLVWIVSTLRSTDYTLVQSDPLLLKLKEDGATLDLAPPDSVAISEAIAGPSEAAGLAFERDPESGHGLDHILRADAGGRDALPLLQFTLQNLFEAREVRDKVPTLTIAAYRALGGIEGAIAAEAERTVNALPADSQSRLPWLLRQLVGISRHAGDAAATLRDWPVDESELAERPGSPALIEALANARVLVLDSTEGGKRRLRLAHEAVLRSWGRARDVVAENTRYFRVRNELEDSFDRWKRENEQRELLLPVGTPLADAEALIASHGDELPDAWSAYVKASRRKAERARRVAYGVAAVMAVLFVASAVTGFLAWRSEQQAALDRDAALIAQSRHIATQARQLSLAGDVGTALALALEGLPTDLAKPDRPYDVLAEGAALEQTLQLREQLIIADHKAQVSSVLPTADGKQLLTASWDGTARLWDSSSGKELASFDNRQPLTNAALSPDGRLMVATAFDGSVVMWDIASRRPIRKFSGHTSFAMKAVFSPDGSRLASASWDQTVRVWDVASGRELLSLPHDKAAQAVAFSPDGTRLATGQEGGQVRIWDAVTGDRLIEVKHGTNASAVVFSQDGKRIATASWDRTAAIWNAETGEEIAVMRGHQDSVVSVAFSPSGHFLATGSWDGTVRLWMANADERMQGIFGPRTTGEELGVLRGHGATVQSVVFLPEGNHVASASTDGTVRVWNIGSLPGVRRLPGNLTLMNGVAFSPDGTRLVAPSWSKQARIWDVTTVNELMVLNGHGNNVTDAVFSRDGTRVATASYDRTARVWDVASGKELAKMEGHDSLVTGVAISPDGKLVATAAWDAAARLWDASTGKLLTTIKVHDGGQVHAVAFSPDGTRLVGGGNGSLLRVWEVPSGREVLKLTGSESTVTSVTYDLGGARIATGGLDKNARIWDAVTGKQLMVLRGHDHTVNAVSFSPDGKRLATASNDHTARLWDAATGRELARLRGHVNFVTGVAFSPDGHWLATSGNDAQVLLWPYVQGQEVIDRACSLMVRMLSAAQRQQYFLDPAPKNPRCGRALPNRPAP